MALFDFFNKKRNQAARLEELEKLLTQTTKWKYRGIHPKFLDVDFGEAFLESISYDKNKHVTLRDLKIWGNKLQEQNKIYSKSEIEELSKQANFNAWEAFDWEKEYLETIKNISNLSLPAWSDLKYIPKSPTPR